VTSNVGILNQTPNQTRVLGIPIPGPIKTEFNYSYGDNHIAAKYCGYDSVPGHISGEWQHGWIVPERNVHPEFVVGSDGLSRTRKQRRYFVARKDQQEYLQSQEYSDVVAIGLPIVYVDKPKVERISGSLLVMPIHSLSDTQERWNDEEYAQYIESIAHNFNKIVLCVHSSCYKKGNWIKAFQKRSIPAVIGADPEDGNTYERLATLFSRFEFVTTNAVGSHIAYAAYFGAKPSVAGPKPYFEKRDYERLTFYKNAPEVLNIVAEWNADNRYKKIFPFLFVEPHIGVNAQKWAEQQLGEQNKKSPNELKHLFGWSLEYRFRKIVMSFISVIKKKVKFSLVILVVIRKRLFARRFVNELKIFTHMTFDEKYALYWFTQRLPENAICAEIGSYLGASSCFISAGIARSGKLYCIDTWGNHAMAYNESDGNDTNLVEKDTYAEFRKNTEQYRDRIIELRGWSTEVIDELKKKEPVLDFLFIDGDHNYEGVKKDWDLYRPLCTKNTLVAFHDTGWAEGVQRVVKEDVSPIATLVKKLPNMEIYSIK